MIIESLNVISTELHALPQSMWTISEERFEAECSELLALAVAEGLSAGSGERAARHDEAHARKGSTSGVAAAEELSAGSGAQAAVREHGEAMARKGSACSADPVMFMVESAPSWEWVPETRDNTGTLRLRPGYLRLRRQLVRARRPTTCREREVNYMYRCDNGDGGQERDTCVAASGSSGSGVHCVDNYDEEDDEDDGGCLGGGGGGASAREGMGEWFGGVRGQPATDAAELDTSALPSTAGSARIAEFEYHVLYSQAYAVPVLYFCVTELDGTPVTGDDLWECVLPCKM